MNLTKFVLDPFTEKARFDWEEFRKVVKIFNGLIDLETMEEAVAEAVASARMSGDGATASAAS